jgi:hypothetical protein
MAYCHADEKQQSSSEAERFKNAKTYFDATIVQTQAWGMWDPPPVTGSKRPEQSMGLRTGALIYTRGKDLRKWLTKATVGFQDMWHKHGEDGEDSYDFQPSGYNNAVDWWAECEDKVLQGGSSGVAHDVDFHGDPEREDWRERLTVVAFYAVGREKTRDARASAAGAG